MILTYDYLGKLDKDKIHNCTIKKKNDSRKYKAQLIYREDKRWTIISNAIIGWDVRDDNLKHSGDQELKYGWNFHNSWDFPPPDVESIEYMKRW